MCDIIKNVTFNFFLFLFINQISFSQTPVRFNNFPVIYFKEKATNYYAEGMPIIADFLGNGQKQIAVGTHILGVGLQRMFMIDINGNVLSGWPRIFDINSGRRYGIVATAAGDINKDGKIELIVKTADSLYVLDYKGDNITGFPVYFPEYSFNVTPLSLSLFDLESNGSLNIIVTASNKIIVYNPDGSIKSGWSKSIGNNALFGTGITIGDLNGDQKSEIITSSSIRGNGNPHDSNYIRIYDRNGNYFSGWPVYSDSGYTVADASIVFKQDNSNPSNSELYIITSIYDTALAPDFNRITIYGVNGNIKKRWYYNSDMTIYSPLVADFNRDGQDELFCGEQDWHVFLYKMDGTRLPGWDNLSGSNIAWWQSCICKIKYGNQLCAITPKQSVFPDSLNTYRGRIYAYDFNGIQSQDWPLKPMGIASGMAFSDINSDGSVEIISTGWNDTAFLNIYTIPGIPYTNADFPWPMFAHDRYRTNQLGFVPPDEAIGIKPISNNIPGQFVLYQNYPNPFNPVTTIKFDIPANQQRTTNNVQLIIFDILGREVSTPINEQLKPGTYEVVWPAPSGDGSNFSSGVYYYQLRAGNYIDTKKLVLVK
jgi:hypothetical protein